MRCGETPARDRPRPAAASPLDALLLQLSRQTADAEVARWAGALLRRGTRGQAPPPGREGGQRP